MGVTIGSTGVGSVTLGGMPVAAIHVGTTKVWPSIASMDIDVTGASISGYRGYIMVNGLRLDGLPDPSTITAIEIVEGSNAGTSFEITGAEYQGLYTAYFYGPLVFAYGQWATVTKIRIYYTP